MNVNQVGAMFASIFKYVFHPIAVPGGRRGAKIYKFIFVAMILSGAVLEGSFTWDILDTFNGLMMSPNLIGVVSLLPLVLKITGNYVDRKIKHKQVKPILSYDPDIK